MHLRTFTANYWKALAGTAVWLAAVASCALIPDTLTYFYGTIWAGAVVLTAGFFVLGYVRFSKPSKDPVTHKREWSGVWAWVLTNSAIILLVFCYLLFFRITNDPPTLTDDRIQQYRIGAGIYVTVFFAELWITWIWTWRQIHSRRARVAA